MKKNTKEFMSLIERYETITIDEIRAAYKKYAYTLLGSKATAKKELTGFGQQNACTLCIAVNGACNQCVYGGWIACVGGAHGTHCRNTYDAINNAKTPTQLLRAYRARAKYMRTLIDK